MMFKISINYKKIFGAIYVCLILFMPDFIKSITTIYRINASEYIFMYPWLSYSLSFLEIPCILFAIFLRKRNDYTIDIRALVIFIIVKEIVFALQGMDSIFLYGDYAIILGLLVGAGCYYILVNTCEYQEEDLLDLIIILNFFFQVLFIVTGRVMIDGRYSTLGSNVGEIGTFCSHYLLYYLFYRNKEERPVITILSCIGGLIISASRTNIILSILFIILFAFDIKKGLNDNPEKARTIGFLVCLAVMVIPFLSTFLQVSSNGFGILIQRTQGALQSLFRADTQYLSSDSSFSDRLLSFTAGFGILADHPFGISASAIDLQIKTIEHGYFYFPHSTLLAYYLLWSVATLVIFFFIIRLLIESIKQKSNLSILIIYILTSFVFYGAPIINCKTYFWYLCILSICKKDLNVITKLPLKMNSD